MRTHIQRSELEAMGVCVEYQGDSIPDAWGDRTEMTLEYFIIVPINDGTPTPSRDALWVFVNLMSRQERLRLGLTIINEVEESSPNSTVRDSLDLMTLFIGENSSEQEVATQREIVEALLHETEQETQLYKMVNATRQLMNPTESQKSIMRICRFIENHHPNATYAKFTNFAIQILKEEI